MDTAEESVLCQYPAWMEERMREHKATYGFNPGRREDDYITVPMAEWLRLRAMKDKLKIRYRSGYHAGYDAGRFGRDVKLRDGSL